MSVIDNIISSTMSVFSKRDYTMTNAISDWLAGKDLEVPNPASSGASVTPATSLTLSTVYACVKILSETIGSLPLPVYRDMSPRGREQAKGHPLYKLLHDRPNPYQTSFGWRSLTITHQCLWGAGISEIEYDKKGYPVALWPLPPWKVEPMRSETGDIYYKVYLDNSRQRHRYLTYNQVLVFPAISTSSFEWMSPIKVQKETLGLALGVKEFGSRVFGQGTNPAGIVTTPGRLDSNSEKSLKENLKQYSGLGNSHRLMLLTHGAEFKRVGLPPEDAQFLATRSFSVEEIARMFNVPLFMLQHHEKQTSWGSGIEEQKNGFVTFSLTPHIVKIEQEIKYKLFEDIAPGYYAEFNLQGLLRGNLKDRVEAYRRLFEMSAMSANEIRDKENMNPIESGDKYYMPLNIGEVGKIKDTENNNEG